MKLKEALSQWLKLCLFLLVGMLVVRLFFYLQVHFRIEVESSQFVNIAKGSVFDFYLACHAATWLLVPFLLLHRFFPKTALRLGVGLVFAYVVVAALLTEYFCNIYMPLDHVVLVYSPSELRGTATSSASVTAAPILWFLGTVAAVVLVWLALRKLKPGWVVATALLVVALVVAVAIPYRRVVREERYFQDHATFCLAVNQPSYSYIKITDYLRKAKHPEEANSIPVDEASYPFLRKADDPDVLGSFFEPTSDSLPPNFVFIIVESLGQRLTGVDRPEMSFTPFIDSLKREGLYWEHCLSTSERTFGVLPSVFASAPYGKYGFYMSTIPMPNHNSLLRDMKRNGYETRYYYGAADEFGRFDIFLKANKLDYIFFPGAEQLDSTHFEKLNEVQRWGIDDRETVACVKENLQRHPSPRPRTDIIMTLTTHEPFFFDDIEPYEKRVKDMLKAHPELSKIERRNIKRKSNIYACFLYMDDCVRDLMDFYSTLPEYENTVFVITGDHRMGPLRFKNPLSQFTVPLLVYSPLLKQPRSMEAVVSHLDITPTVNAWLHGNYDYEINEYCHWMGTSIDTALAYENTHRQAFMLNNRDVVDYIHGDYMLSNNRLYRIDEELLSHPLDDDSLLNRMKLELDTFNTLSQFAVMNDHLMPVLFETEVLCDYVRDEQRVLDSEMLFGSLFEPMTMVTDRADLMLDIVFDYQSPDAGQQLPVVGVEMGSYLMMLPLDADDGHFHRHVSILNEESKDKLLKVYLFNPHKATIKYGNIKINVTVVKE